MNETFQKMKSIHYKTIVKYVTTMLLVIVFSCGREQGLKTSFNKNRHFSSMEEIRNNGKIVAVTDYNSTNYFVYKGEPMGYQYELLQSLADYLGVKLEVIVSKNLPDIFTYLEKGNCDLIATNLTVTNERSKFLEFTEANMTTRQVLVQRKPDGWQKTRKDILENQLLRNQLDLAGKTVYVQEGSVYAERLKSLSNEIGDSIHVVEMNDVETEQLIKLVADGEIEYTVCDEMVGKVNQTYYPNIDISTAVSFPQKLAWAVSKDNIELKDEIDKWLRKFKRSSRYANIYNKYFKNLRSAKMVKSEFYANESGKVSIYDTLFKKYSKELNWDWRLLASLVYQESNFQPNVKSWAGAFGLMQLMPATAERFGIDSLATPEDNIKAGVEYIRWLENILSDKVPDPKERKFFVMASYNVGLGHVLDAQRLAKKFGKNPQIWFNSVDKFLLNKSKPEYYSDPVVKYGYCRGDEPFNYVSEIYERYEHYRNIIPAEESLQ